jgi:peptide methionine sulfoxide reductase MsrB
MTGKDTSRQSDLSLSDTILKKVVKQMNSEKLTANQYYILREKEQSALFRNEFHDNHKREIIFVRVVNCSYFRLNKI